MSIIYVIYPSVQTDNFQIIYVITLSYPQPDIIQIESKMIIKNETVPAKDVVNVAAVFNAIEQLNKKELVLKLQ